MRVAAIPRNCRTLVFIINELHRLCQLAPSLHTASLNKLIRTTGKRQWEFPRRDPGLESLYDEPVCMTSLVEAFYGLKNPAFTVSKNSGPVLITSPLRTVAKFLRRELDGCAPLLCVTGPSGIGKSSVARALPKLTGGRFRIAAMSGRAESWDDLRQPLTTLFGLDEGRITREGLEAARAKFGKLLIVVDDAQFLTPELLQRICILPQLHTDAGEPVTQVVLFADLDAVALNDARPLRAWFDLDALIVMEPLPPSDVRHYTDTRLQQVGWSGDPLFSDSGAWALHRLSLGNPRRLSAACTDVLEQAASRGLRLIDASFVIECMGEEGTGGEMLRTPADTIVRDGLSETLSPQLTNGSIHDTGVERPAQPRCSVGKPITKNFP